MGPVAWVLLAALGSHISRTVSEAVVCFSDFNEQTGGCSDYLGDGVSEEDCCLNIMYSFKREAHSRCEACRAAEWSQWSAWGPCTVSCLEGVQKRERVCTGQGDCDGDSVEVQACSVKDCCPKEGSWSSWSPWSPCSVTCEKGTTQRTRQCNNPAPICGGICPGSSIETVSCDTRQICPTHGQWGSWGPWGECSSSCIVEGSGVFPPQTRKRECNNPAPSVSPPGRSCGSESHQSKDCTVLPFCPVPGGWGAWKPESECSVTCGIGRIKEKRFCDNPAPKYGGRYCEGPVTRNTMCNTKVGCPTDGHWSSWQPWSPCTRLQDVINCSQKVGTQSRKRVCEEGRFEGNWCESNHKESRNCYNVEGCRLQGKWSEWSAWGLCLPPCGKSERTRKRECEPIYPDYPDHMLNQLGKLVDVFFSGTPNVHCDPINKETLKVEEKRECRNVIAC
ncbi:hypothetical protein GDO86_014715 [Hymenochirus boettgeri]|uniref:Properdin n=1 Tax=Hymenochirus boettgeri TaxID=247094 RepID=A0A8T2JV30_9PIPI|nr:hypothetical protein GDO86_014715 [Hymenochirus boettgeri]